jgi:hypothetical protein
MTRRHLWDEDDELMHLQDDLAAEFGYLKMEMEDPIIHTPEHPFCDDPDCPCWQEWTEREAETERRFIEARMRES